MRGETMTAFDYAVLAVILLSAALGIWRGFVYEIFALGAWITGIVCAVIFGTKVAAWIPLKMDEWLKIIAAYALVFVVVFIFVGVLGFLLTKMIRAVGLSPVDRGLGAMFGVVRGLLIVVVVVFLLSFSGLRETDWWRNSVSAKPFETMAGILRYRLPDSVTKHFKMSAATTGFSDRNELAKVPLEILFVGMASEEPRRKTDETVHRYGETFFEHATKRDARETNLQRYFLCAA
jgi:membrane protein required for colicin V production